jgi:hypothetical protein
MAQLRTVVISSTRIAGSEPFRITTDAETWEELSNKILLEKGIDCSDLKVLVQETEEELKHSDDDLPEGDFTLVLFPSKAKAGL